MKQATIVFFILFMSSMVLAQNATEFSSAEERIVFNNSHNLNKYNGVLIEYSYKIVCSEPHNDKELIKIASQFFNEIVGVEIYEHNGSRYLSVLTKGSVENHKASFRLRDNQANFFEFYKRNYHLE